MHSKELKQQGEKDPISHVFQIILQNRSTHMLRCQLMHLEAKTEAPMKQRDILRGGILHLILQDSAFL